MLKRKGWPRAARTQSQNNFPICNRGRGQIEFEWGGNIAGCSGFLRHVRRSINQDPLSVAGCWRLERPPSLGCQRRRENIHSITILESDATAARHRQCFLLFFCNALLEVFFESDRGDASSRVFSSFHTDTGHKKEFHCGRFADSKPPLSPRIGAESTND